MRLNKGKRNIPGSWNRDLVNLGGMHAQFKVRKKGKTDRKSKQIYREDCEVVAKYLKQRSYELHTQKQRIHGRHSQIFQAHKVTLFTFQFKTTKHRLL